MFLDGDEAAADRATHRVRAIGRAELADDRGDVELDRLIADAKRKGDRLVRQTLGQTFEHVLLARRQRFFRGLINRAATLRRVLPSRFDDRIGAVQFFIRRRTRGSLADDLQTRVEKIGPEPIALSFRPD